MINQNANIAENERVLPSAYDPDRYYMAKESFPEILKECLGIVTNACRKAGVSREWYYQQIRNDEEFAKKCAEANEVAIDFVETSLFKQIKDLVPSSTMFYLKTRAKHRGYGEDINIIASNKDGSPRAILSDQDILDNYYNMRRKIEEEAQKANIITVSQPEASPHQS